MRQFVDNDIISYPLRHRAYAVGDADRASAVIAAAELGILVSDVFNGADSKLIFKVAQVEFLCPLREILMLI